MEVYYLLYTICNHRCLPAGCVYSQHMLPVGPVRQAGNQFLGSLKGLKIRALLSQGWGGVPMRIEAGSALQQAGALISELRRTLYVHYRIINAVEKKIRRCHTMMFHFIFFLCIPYLVGFLRIHVTQKTRGSVPTALI
jgi:hypothetical protein